MVKGKTTSKKVGKVASKVLRNRKSNKASKTVAGSTLVQVEKKEPRKKLNKRSKKTSRRGGNIAFDSSIGTV